MIDPTFGPTFGPASGPARFVTDSSLEQLARRLRFLGYDVLSHRGARLEELFDDAAREGRIVLTLSSRRPRRHAGVPALVVPRRDLAVAVRLVAARHAPATARWSRCPSCNVALQSRSAFEARGEVPSRVTRGGSPLTWCPACGRWYWRGSHVERMERWFDEVLGPGGPTAGGPA